MEGLERALGHEVLLGEHLDRVGDGMEKAYEREAQDVGAVGADAVLHDGALLAFDPAQQARDAHAEGQGEGDFHAAPQKDHERASWSSLKISQSGRAQPMGSRAFR